MTRHLASALIAAALAATSLTALAGPCAAQSVGVASAQNADTANRIRNGRVMSTNRAVQAAQEKRERAIQGQLARLNARPAPPPQVTIAAGGAVITAPVSSGPALGQGLVVNNTTLFVNIQNGDGNVATNTLVAAAKND